MKKLFNFSILCAILAIATSGCDIFADPQEEKPNDPTGETPSTGGGAGIKLVTYLYDSSDGGGTFNYEYDNQNRLTKITVTGSNNNGVWNVTYPTSNTIRYVKGNDSFFFTKNSQGYVTYYEANVLGVKATQNLEYANGYLTKTSAESMGLTINQTFVWNSGKLDAIESRSAGLVIDKITFTYTSRANKEGYISPWTMSEENGNRYCPASWSGKMSPNLVATKTNERFMIGTTTISYRYDINTDGYVTKVYAKENAGAEYLLYEVKYK